MSEYLFYVSLVFIPIACWIAFLLYRDGFEIKTIAMVLILSYLMIIAFPFSIQHLGLSITVLVYSAMFAVLILVMCKPELFNLGGQADELSSEFAGKSSLTVPGGETTVFAISSELVKNQPSETLAVAGTHSPNNSQVTDSIPEEILVNEAIARLEADAASTAESVTTVGMSEQLETEAADVCKIDNDQNSAPEQAASEPEQPAAVISQELAEQPEQVTEPAYIQIPEDRDSQSDHGREFQDADVGDKLLSADSYTPALSEGIIIDGSPISSEQQAIAAEDFAAAPAAVDYNLETQDNQNQDIIVYSDTAVPAGPGRQPDYQAELADWIETGFESKTRGDLAGAAENFTRALLITTDNELKYMLGMEVVSILQNTGNYEQAESILDELIETIGAQTAIIMELQKQKQYISLLASELNRLGLAGTPISEVPRFVRMKVNEKMLA